MPRKTAVHRVIAPRLRLASMRPRPDAAENTALAMCHAGLVVLQ